MNKLKLQYYIDNILEDEYNNSEEFHNNTEKQRWIFMKKECTLRELESVLSECEDIDEPIVIKRENKSDIVVLSLKEYKEKLLELEIIKHLQKSEEDIETGRTISANQLFEELRAEYEY